jgi:hypothetical protein
MTGNLKVSKMFDDMIRQGYITPKNVVSIEDLRMPGELPYIPTIATYGTGFGSTSFVGGVNAKLEQRS